MRFPASWNQLAEKESHQINNLEQILVAKVFNFCGICSNGGSPGWRNWKGLAGEAKLIRQIKNDLQLIDL